MSRTITVAVTGAAGQIGYSLVPRLINGEVFGKDTIVNLNLVEIPPAMDRLQGTIMELQDCAFDTSGEIKGFSDIHEGFADADFVLLVGSLPRGIVFKGKKIEERSDLLAINGGIFSEQGAAIGKVAKADATVLVVGNPANTNCLIGQSHANKDTQHWYAMTALDANRAQHQLGAKLGVHSSLVKNLCIWGNHSPTMYPDTDNATVNGESIRKLLNNDAWLTGEFLPTVQQRGKAVIDARGASSALSAANGAIDTLKGIVGTTPAGSCFSAAISGDSQYGVDSELVFGLPLSSDGSNVSVLANFEIDEFARSYLQRTEQELKEERDAVRHLLKS